MSAGESAENKDKNRLKYSQTKLVADWLCGPWKDKNTIHHINRKVFGPELISIHSFYLTSYGNFLFQVKAFPTSWSIWHISYAGAKMSFMRKSRPFSE